MSSLLQQVVVGQAPSLRQFTADEYHQQRIYAAAEIAIYWIIGPQDRRLFGA